MAATIGPNSPASAMRDEGLEDLGREVVVHVAVGQRQRADPLAGSGRRRPGPPRRRCRWRRRRPGRGRAARRARRAWRRGRCRERSAGARPPGPASRRAPGRSGAMQRRTSATSQMTLRHRSALTSTPWTKSAAGASVAVALVDVRDVAAGQSADLCGAAPSGGGRRVRAFSGLGGGGHASYFTYQLSVCKDGIGFRRAHAGRTHRGHPGPAHRDGPPPLRARRASPPPRPRRSSSEADGQPRRALPPLLRARPTCSRRRSKRSRTS